MAIDFIRAHWQDLADILIVGYIIYRILLMIKGTRALRMLFGLAALILVYFFSRRFGLVTTQWIINNFLIYIVVIVVILFQNEIRKTLSEMGKNPFFSDIDVMGGSQSLEELLTASVSLANKHIGALIAVERQTGLKNYIEGGVIIDSKISRDLILSIFQKNSPIHDGAVIVQKGRFKAAGCFLPLTLDVNISKELGTRHRAAIGLTEETDAVVIVISEERGSVSLALEGDLLRDLEIGELREILYELFIPKKKKVIATKVKA